MQKQPILNGMCTAKALGFCFGLFAFAYSVIWGGVYLDTDVEAVRTFDPLIENYSCFMGYEADNIIGTGIIGAEAHHPTIRALLEFYDKKIWQSSFFNNPMIFSDVHRRNPEVFKNCMILPQSCFSPYEPNAKTSALVDGEDTYAIHWYTANWNMSRKGYVFLNTKHIQNPILKILISMKKSVGYYRHH